jgi:hypothetical protein
MKIIFYRESLLQSLLSDIITYGFLLFSVWFNIHFCGNSYFLNAILLIMFLLLIIGSGNNKKKTFFSTNEVRKYLDMLDYKDVKEGK